MEERNIDGLTEKEFLEQYKPGNYDRPSVTADAVIFKLENKTQTLKLLLIKRKNHPYINKWALPGGFVNVNEDIDEAVLRELKEETNVENVYMEQLRTYGKPNRDPRMRVISVAYVALINADVKVSAGDDASEAKWFDVNWNNEKIEIKDGNTIIKNSEIAFDHIQIIYDALIRVRNKVEYTDIIFDLMPKEFTLPELQKVYENLLGKTVYKTNFRNKMKAKLEDTGKIKSDGAHRPSRIYTVKETI